MNSQTGEHLEDLRAECTALRKKICTAKDRLAVSSDSNGDPHLPKGKSAASDPTPSKDLDRAIGDAANAALQLMETALTERIRAASMERSLQHETEQRLRAEEALRKTEHRCRRIMDAIGHVRWISTEDWETILEIDKGD